MTGSAFWDFWYFHIPNYLAAVVTYTLIGRFLLSLFLPPESPNYIWRFFRRISDWAVAGVRLITPAYLLPVFLPLVAAFWLGAFRYLYRLLLAAEGMAPPAGFS